MYINNYGTDFMFSGHGVCNISIYYIVSYNFQFPFSFQDIILVCWNFCLQVLIMEFIHKS